MTPPPPLPLVSVVIPCYAQAHFLRDAIDSVFGQTYRAFELIVVNDGSPDTPVLEAVLAAYREQVTYVVQANMGLSGARNAGLARARGEFVTFLDADDRLLPDALQAGVDTFAVHPASGLVWGLNRLIDAQGELLDSGERKFITEGGYPELLEKNFVGPPLGVMFRRTTVMAAGGFSPLLRFAEDYGLYLCLARQLEVHCHGQLVGEYRIHGANMSHNHQGMLAGVLQALEMQEEWLGDDPVLRRALRKGRRTVRLFQDGEPRVARLAEHVHAGHWLRAIGSASVLLLKYPELLLRVVTGRIRRGLRVVGR